MAAKGGKRVIPSMTPIDESMAPFVKIAVDSPLG